MINITADAVPDAWKEVCLITVVTNAGTLIHFTALTEDITAMDWMEKDIEGIPILNGGRVVKHNMTGEESITMKVYPVDAWLHNSNVAQGVVQLFHPQGSVDNTGYVYVDNTLTRNLHRIIILWASTLPANAATQPAADKTAYRIQIVNAYMTQYKPSFDDKIFSAEMTFKWTPFNKAAVANKREESTDGTAQLAATGTSVTVLTS